MSPKSSSKSSASKSKSSGRKGGKSSSNNVGLWIVGISIGVVVLAIGILALNSRQSSASAIAAPDVPEEWLDRSSMGNPEAAVVIETWEDFLCPACRDWSTEMKTRVVNDFVKSGLVRMEFHHFPLESHAPGSMMAALASECAADQGAFWVYHDRLFQVQAAGQSAYQMERLVQYANDLGLDGNQLTQCLTGQKYASAVNDSYTQAISKGLNSTPSVVVNGKVMADPFDYRALSAEIDALLEASEGSD